MKFSNVGIIFKMVNAVNKTKIYRKCWQRGKKWYH